eukprot:7122609-Pyramimonas_sp.AAC.1
MKAWYDKRTSDFEIFCPGTQAWQQWTNMGVTVIRSAALTWDQVKGGGGRGVERRRGGDKALLVRLCGYGRARTSQ